MYYELYVDSLFLLNFVMNLLCLELVNLFMMRAAKRKRVIGGAVMGAVMYIASFLVPVSGWMKIMILFPLSVVFMIVFVFRPIHVNALGHITKAMLAASFLLGGALACLIFLMPAEGGLIKGLPGILGISALVFMETSRFIKNRRKSYLCRVELIGKGAKITVNALMDNGNSLTEPVSGQPVCILEKSVFEGLWRNGGPEGFRVIPYCSVGKERGILYGYPIPEIKIDNQGIISRHTNIYVGVVDKKIACSKGYCMILNPMIFENKKMSAS